MIDNNVFHDKKVAFHTLGCKLNFAETSAIGKKMADEGFVKIRAGEQADVCVINTCSVTDTADRKCRQAISKLNRLHPNAIMVVTGCYAQLKPDEISKIEGVDLVLGANEKFSILEYIRNIESDKPAEVHTTRINKIKQFEPSCSRDDRTRYFLKVQDGCDYNCSFCTIPLARGKSRSDSIENIIRNVATIAEQGAKEIVLTGINLGDFGKGLHGGKQREENFFELVSALDKVKGIERYRISSIEPNLLTNEIIELVSNSEKFMPHFHIPLQSGSNKILGLMRRRYKKELYQERVGVIKTMMPHCCVGVDVIVGFPGETAEDFIETVDFLTALDISYLHVFTYSERANTLAVEMKDAVPVHIRNERNKILRNLSYQKMQYFTNQHVGQDRKVLFESHNKNGTMEGYTDNYIKVTAPFKKEWENNLVTWKI